MKRLMGTILACTFVFTLGTTSALAAPSHCGSRSGYHTYAADCQFVDEDEDGICDIHSADCWFTDENQDGICDNYLNDDTQMQEGTRRSGHRSSGGGCGNHGSRAGRGR